MQEIKTPQLIVPAVEEAEVIKRTAELARLAPKTTVMNISLEEVLGQVGSIYKLCNLAARRALELSGGQPKLASCESSKPTTIALAEIRQGKVKVKEKKK